MLDPELLGEGLADELERRKIEEPLRYVQFNPAVRRFAESWCDPEKKIIIFAASNSIGKTWATITLLGWTIWPEFAPVWFKSRIEEKVRSMDRSFRITSTVEEAGQAGTVQRAIKSLWPKSRFKSEKNRKAFASIFETDSLWVGDVMTYDQEVEQFEGATRGLIIYNEPPPEEIRKACVFRTRMGGFEVFPMTPLSSAQWISDKLVDRSHTDSKISLIKGEMEDACKEHSVNGHLSHQRIQELISEMDPDEIRARAYGEFMHMAGRIFGGFSRDKFMSRIPLPRIYPSVPFQVIDPGGYNKPFAIIWGQVVANPMHGLQILREWPNGGTGPEQYFENVHKPELKVEDYAKLFASIEKELGFDKAEVHRIMDKRFGHVKDNLDGKSLRDYFADEGYFYQDSYSVPGQTTEILTGIQAIKNYLKIDKTSKMPYLILDPSCINTARALERWGLDPKTNKPKDDVWKNFVDIVRYLASAGLQLTLSEPSDIWNSDTNMPSWRVG